MGEIRHLPTRLRELIEHRITPDMLKPGLFIVTFNNYKKQGKQGLKTHTCYGALFPEGNVYLNTEFITIHDFLSVGDMVEFLEKYGDCILQQGEHE